MRLGILGLALLVAGCAASEDDEPIASVAAGGGGGTAGATGAGGSPSGDGGAPVVGPKPTGGTGRFLYIESNDPNGNAIIAFERGEDGTLSPVPGGFYPTGGIGISAGPNQRLGPLDSDRNLVLSADEQFLYAVNSGSDSIAAFRTRRDGSLSRIDGSPFPSGGANPVSLAVVGGWLYVVNKAVDGTTPPTYTAFSIEASGALEPIAESTVELSLGASPAIAEVSPQAEFLFATQFFDQGRAMMAPTEQIDSFVIGEDGILTPALGSPYALPPDTSGLVPAPPAVALGLAPHPLQNVLYAAFPTRNQLAVYDYDEMGVLTFVDTFPNSGEGISRLLVNANASRLYSVNSLSGTISIYDIMTSRIPIEMHSLTPKLAMAGPAFVDAAGTTQTVTSQPFQVAFDEEQTHLYVLSQRVTTNANDLAGNYLHTLRIDSDGDLSERAEPVDLAEVGVPSLARPQGIVLY